MLTCAKMPINYIPQPEDMHAQHNLTIIYFIRLQQGITKWCRLSWLTNSALSYKSPNAGSQPMSTAVHKEPKVTLEIQLHI